MADRKSALDTTVGSINRSGSIRCLATAVGADTTLAQIIGLVLLAQNSKVPGRRLADNASQYLVILAVGSQASSPSLRGTSWAT